MDYYQGVVTEYLRADRSLFLNTECCIQLNEAANPDAGGAHWYCDALACDFRGKAIFLCETTFSNSLGSLVKRLGAWQANWDLVLAALRRDCHLPDNWPARPWLFVPTGAIPLLIRRLTEIGGAAGLPFTPRITPLEMVQPWLYRSWDRVGEAPKPETIPEEMRV